MADHENQIKFTPIQEETLSTYDLVIKRIHSYETPRSNLQNYYNKNFSNFEIGTSINMTDKSALMESLAYSGSISRHENFKKQYIENVDFSIKVISPENEKRYRHSDQNESKKEKLGKLIKRCSNIQISIQNEKNSLIDLRSQLKLMDHHNKDRTLRKECEWRKPKQ